MKNNKTLKNIFLVLLSGILIFLSFPYFNLFFLIWLAFVPLFFLIKQEKDLSLVLFVFIAGLTANIGIFYWIYPMIKFNTKSWIQAFLCLFMLASYLSIYYVLWALLCKYIKKYFSKWIFCFFAAALWVALEYGRTYFLSGFPWALLGYSQWRYLPLIQISEYTGVYGVSFLIILCNAFLFHYIKTRKILMLAFFLTVPIVISAAGMGVFKKTYVSDTKIKVAVLQGNIDQYKKWNISYQNEIINIYTNLVKKVSLEKPDVIIWPETSVPGYLTTDIFLKNWVENLIKESKTYHIIGSPYFDGSKYYNSTILFNPEGKIEGIHRKNHLVPFGEYVPLRKIFEPFFGVLNTLGDFSSAQDSKPFIIKNISFGTTICSENFFGSIVRKFVQNGAQILVNQTNDAWFFKSAAADQHFIMNVFRAVENRRPVIVCGNTGVSGIIGARGKIMKRTVLFTEDYFVYDEKPSSIKTFYSNYGDIFALACIGFIVLIMILSIKKKELYP
ncbi:MAG: apolipoprotein N-acyltransferase [Elusimicrobia bacterium]|nr:apolipoprotein N-acyltransferase [Elusimicrobiota bacterium]